jgi:sialate O-acetylesterase
MLSNGMIEPLIPFALQGCIWYQGESNTKWPYRYRKLFPSLIRDWRKRWGERDFPFLFVQLANFRVLQKRPVEDDTWAELREAQLMALDEPMTGMVVAIDIGEADSVHPKNKKEVGRRLALKALKVAYDCDSIYSSPIFEKMIIDDYKIHLLFEDAGKGLITKDDEEIKGFAIAGKNRQFYRASAIIKEDTVIVWNPNVKNPVAVRYGWAANPLCNLLNSTGLPVSPFRTDNWPGITHL